MDERQRGIRSALGNLLIGREAMARLRQEPLTLDSPQVQEVVDKAVAVALENRPDGPSWAAQIPAYENTPASAYGVRMTTSRNMPDKDGESMERLRDFSLTQYPSLCISTRVNQASAYTARSEGGKFGVLDKPGWRIRLRDGKGVPDKLDRANMEALSRFIECNGWAEPPEPERPLGWQPSFDYTMKTLIADAFAIDFNPLMRWKDGRNPKDFPIVSFSTQDPVLFRRWAPEVKNVQAGRVFTEEPPDGRPTATSKPHRFCRLQEGSAGRPVAWYTEDELAVLVRNPRTQTSRAGYGMSETEDAVRAITDMVKIAEYNTNRFDKDNIPRGFINILGNVSPEARTAFANSWKQTMAGQRWAIPILTSVPPGPDGKGGHSVQWVPMDNATRDMEYSQLMYQSIVALHAAYHISPEETGLAEASPFSSSLSEASPASYLKWSRDQFGHLMISIARFINSELIWKMPGGKRYLFEWTGLIEYEALQEAELIGALLANGEITTREIWEARGKPLPKILADSPAVDLPMPIAEALQYLDMKEQQDMMMEEAERQKAEEEAASQAQRAGKLGMGQAQPQRPSIVPVQGGYRPAQAQGPSRAQRPPSEAPGAQQQPSRVGLRRPGFDPQDRV